MHRSQKHIVNGNILQWYNFEETRLHPDQYCTWVGNFYNRAVGIVYEGYKIA